MMHSVPCVSGRPLQLTAQPLKSLGHRANARAAATPTRASLGGTANTPPSPRPATKVASAAVLDAPARVIKPVTEIAPVNKLKDRPLTVVDLHDFDNRKEEIIRDLMEAATGHGFWYITNHGIPQEDIDEAFRINLERERLPMEMKLKQQDAVDKSNQGYIPGYSIEKNAVAHLRRSFLSGFSEKMMEGKWPLEEDLPGYREKIMKFMWQNQRLVEKLMGCFALGMGLPEDFFFDDMDPRHEDNATTLNNNYYPSLEGISMPPETLRIYAHTDYECLSLLHNIPGQNGLEVCPGKECNVETALQAEWTEANPIPGAIICNLGDAIEYWSDGVLKANFHRVRYPRPDEYAGERQSMAFFSNCRWSTVCQGPKKLYPALTFQQIMDLKKDYNITDVDMGDLSPEEYLRRQQAYVLGPTVSPVATEPEA